MSHSEKEYEELKHKLYKALETNKQLMDAMVKRKSLVILKE